MSGRVGHPRLAQGTQGETFMLLEIRSDQDGRGAGAAPSNLAIVLDRSGSMKGTRLQNAIRAAVKAVDSLADGDVVSVVAFDTAVSVVVPATVIDAGARDRIRAAITAITLGGDTCISCGIEEGMSQLLRTTGRVDRMIVLSDGDATHGVRDVPGFQRLAESARTRGASITTIGVDLTYNQRILGAVALSSGGRHYFIEDDAALDRAFSTETERLRSTIASDAEASIDLGEGVELDRVFDRSFRREGRRIIVPLGSFSGGDEKTVLLKVRAPAKAPASVLLGNVELRYRDVGAGKDATCSGELGVTITASAADASKLDPEVSGRLQRSKTAAALIEANDLFEQGRPEEARRALAAQEAALKAAADEAILAAPTNKNEIEADFKGQAASISGASSDIDAVEKSKKDAKPAAAKVAGQKAVRRNQEVANPYME
jgi:Ca-activated chloride channel family protein